MNDEEADRPAYLKIHAYYAGKEITGSPIKLKKSDFSGSSTWISSPLQLDQGVNKNALIFTEEYPKDYQNWDNYASTVFGSVITNIWMSTNILGTKTWDDDNDKEGKRPDEITVNLMADGIKKESVKVTAANDWKYSFVNQPIYKTENDSRVKINYTVEEETVENYTATYDGYNITNTLTSTDIAGAKIWNDDNDKEGKRPDEITVNLMADGEKVDSVKVTVADSWKYKFPNKPIYKTENGNRVKINYTVEEEAVANYTATYSGYDIINTVYPKGCYKFTHIDRYGVLRTKTVEVELKKEEVEGYSGNNNQPGVPTYLWTAEAKKLYQKNPLITASLAVTGNESDDQLNVTVYKSDVVWDLEKSSASDATNMTANSSENSVEIFATTKPYTFTFRYHFVKDGKAEEKGAVTKVEYGKPVTFSTEFTDPEKYVYINDSIPEENFCYWSADEAGLLPITTNRTFGMLLRGKWLDQSETDRVVDVYAQYENHLEYDWNPLIEEATFTHMISDENDWVYLDYMVNYLSKDGKIVQDMVAEGDENIRYGLVAVKQPNGSVMSREEMIAQTQSMISSGNTVERLGDKVAYRFEYGKQTDETKPISNFNRVLYTLRSDTEKAENQQFSVIAYITVDGENYYFSEPNYDINVHELLGE